MRAVAAEEGAQPVAMGEPVEEEREARIACSAMVLRVLAVVQVDAQAFTAAMMAALEL